MQGLGGRTDLGGGSGADNGSEGGGSSCIDDSWQTGVGDTTPRRRSTGLCLDGPRAAHPRGTGTLLLLALGLCRLLLEWAVFRISLHSPAG